MGGCVLIDPILFFISHAGTTGDFTGGPRSVFRARQRPVAKGFRPIATAVRLPLIDDHFYSHGAAPDTTAALGLVGRRNGADRHRSGRRRIRRGIRRRVCFECGRHAHRDSSGCSGPISRRRKRTDAAGSAKHGAQFLQSPCVHSLGEVWTDACGCQERPGAARIFHIDGH
jgi:hypothetical protein